MFGRHIGIDINMAQRWYKVLGYLKVGFSLNYQQDMFQEDQTKQYFSIYA